MRALQTEPLDLVFGALAHPVRRAILDDVSEADKTVLELAGSYTMSLNAISKHIKRLEAAGLIRRRLDGSYHRISMNRDAMKVALQWMTHYVPFWNDNLQSLRTSLENRE